MSKFCGLVITREVKKSHLNSLGILSGGQLFKWIDTFAYRTAKLITGYECVTINVERLQFLSPSYLYNEIQFTCRLLKSGKSSITISVLCENDASNVVAQGELTFVALDDSVSYLSPKIWNT